MTLYDYLKYNLAQQIRERRAALELLSDRRFDLLRGNLNRALERLEAKYLVPKRLVPEIERLKRQILTINGIP